MKKTHGKYTKRSRNIKSPGRTTITKRIVEFKEGDTVRIVINPQFKEGMPYPRFNNRIGKIVEKRGKSYVVEIRDLKAKKMLAVAVMHLKKMVHSAVKK